MTHNNKEGKMTLNMPVKGELWKADFIQPVEFPERF